METEKVCKNSLRYTEDINIKKEPHHRHEYRIIHLIMYIYVHKQFKIFHQIPGVFDHIMCPFERFYLYIYMGLEYVLHICVYGFIYVIIYILSLYV